MTTNPLHLGNGARYHVSSYSVTGSQTGLTLILKSETLNDLERRNGRILRYFTDFGAYGDQLRQSGLQQKRSPSPNNVRIMTMHSIISRVAPKMAQF